MIMGHPFTFCLGFSGITLRFVLPAPIPIPDNFEPFRCADTDAPDEEYRVVLLNEPLRPSQPLLHQQGYIRIYATEQGWLHIYPALGDGNGCQVACLFCPDGDHTIYYPASRWEEYSRVWCCTHLICGELLLLRHQAVLLHSSIVLYQGKGLLFCGASGAGKSTQAELWHRHLGAKIINGDRTVIRKMPEGFWGGGSMWSGTSRIYHPDQAPIAGIFLVEHGTENRVEPLGFEAFKTLLTQTIVNSWDPDFMERATQLLAELMDSVPIYRLSCLPDTEAVELVKNTLSPPERSNL